MKKFVIYSRTQGRENGIILSGDNAEKVQEDFLEIINDFNGDVSDEKLKVSVFDYVFEVEEVNDISEEVKSFDDAMKYLGINYNCMPVKVSFEKNGFDTKEVICLIENLNPKHIKALIALNELFTIAQAWNQADGFVPDYSDRCQDKWSPWFGYKQSAGFVYVFSRNAPTYSDASYGSRLCFKTLERAEQFGKQFIGLWNDFLSNK